MAEPKRTQKEIAEKYKSILDYYNRTHPLRTWKFLLSVILTVGTTVFAIGYVQFGKNAVAGLYKSGKKEEAAKLDNRLNNFFSTGALTTSHAAVACGECHGQAKVDLQDVLMQVRMPTNAEIASLKNVASSKSGFDSGVRNLLSKTSLEHMDAACLKCHEPYKLHQPQAEQIRLQPVSREMSVVHSHSCSSCHREHTGKERIAIPDSVTCNVCHESRAELERTLVKVPNPAANQPARAEVREVDRLRRFIVPQPLGATPAFITFEQGHPDFRYQKQGVQDLSKIRYNHARHLDPKAINLLNSIPGKPSSNQRRNPPACNYCHQPEDSGGQFFKRIEYKQHCQECHGLQLDPEIKEITLPHGEVAAVRNYLDNLTANYIKYAGQVLRINDPEARSAWFREQDARLRNLGYNSGIEIARRVFWTGSPPIKRNRNTPRSEDAQAMYACQLCHDYDPDKLTNVPADDAAVLDAVARMQVVKPNMPDRWLNHGPFTHQAHTHMECLDCHGGVTKSQLTKEILLPTKASCVECHRRQTADFKTFNPPADPKKRDAELVAHQKKFGGIKSECIDCHRRFHSPPEALPFARNAAAPHAAKLKMDMEKLQKAQK